MELSTFNPVREEVDATAATTGFKGTDITSDDTAHQDFRFRVGLNSTAVPETLYGHNRSVGAVAMAAATLDQHTDSAVHKEYLGVNHDEPSALTSRSGTVWVCTGSSDNTIKVWSWVRRQYGPSGQARDHSKGQVGGQSGGQAQTLLRSLEGHRGAITSVAMIAVSRTASHAQPFITSDTASLNDDNDRAGTGVGADRDSSQRRGRDSRLRLLVCTASEDHTAKLWEGLTGRELHTFRPRSPVTDIAMLCTAGSTAPLGLTDGIKSSLSSFGDGSDSVIHSAGNIGTNTAAATAASAVAWICVTTQDGYIKVYCCTAAGEVVQTQAWAAHLQAVTTVSIAAASTSSSSSDAHRYSRFNSLSKSLSNSLSGGLTGEALAAPSTNPATSVARYVRSFSSSSQSSSRVKVQSAAMLICTGSVDRTIKLWRCDTELGHQLLHTLLGHKTCIVSVALLAVPLPGEGDWPDLRICSVGKGEACPKVWDGRSGKELHTLRGHEASVRSVAAAVGAGGDAWLSSASQDGCTKVWSARTGLELFTLRGHTSAVTAVAMLPLPHLRSGACDEGGKDGKDDGRGDGGDSGLREDKQSERHRSVETIASMLICTGSIDCTAKLYSRRGAALCAFRWHDHWVSAVGMASSLSPSHARPRHLLHQQLRWCDGHKADSLLGVDSARNCTIVCTASKTSVKLWSWDDFAGKLVHAFNPHRANIRALALLWDHSYPCPFGGNGGSAGGIATTESKSDAVATAVWVCTASEDHTAQVHVWTGVKLRKVCSLEGHSDVVRAVSIVAATPTTATTPASATTATMATTADAAEDDAAGGKEGASGHGVAVMESRVWVTTGSEDCTVRVWTVTGSAPPTKCLTLRGHQLAVTSVASLCPGNDGSSMWVCSGSHDRTVKIWDGLAGVLLASLEGHSASVTSVALTLAPSTTGAADAGWVRIASEQLPCPLLWVCSGSADKTAKLWEWEEGDDAEELLCLPHEEGSVTGVALIEAPIDHGTAGAAGAAGDRTGSFDARRRKRGGAARCGKPGVWIATACEDSSVRLWEGSSGGLLRSISSHRKSVLGVALCPSPVDGSVLVCSGSKDGTAWLNSTTDLSAFHRVLFGAGSLPVGVEAGPAVLPLLHAALLRLPRSLTPQASQLLSDPRIVRCAFVGQLLRDDRQNGTQGLLRLFQLLSRASPSGGPATAVGLEICSSEEGFLQRMLTLPRRQLDRIAATPLMANTMAVLLTGRGPLHVLLLDTIGLMLIIPANFPGSWNNSDELIYSSLSFLCAIYFLFRDLLLTGMMMAKRGLFMSWLMDIWNLINIILIGIIFSTFIVTADLHYMLQNSPGVRIQASLMAGFTWLKVLGFIRVFSVDFATFVLALLQISLDIRSFVAVLLLVIVGFTNMFLLIAASGTGGTDDSNEAFRSMGQALLSLFRMMIGDFDMTWFHLQATATSQFAVLLFVIYIMVVNVLMLNILIAVVSDSYAGSVARAQRLYVRSRMELLASIDPIVPLGVQARPAEFYAADSSHNGGEGRGHDDEKGGDPMRLRVDVEYLFWPLYGRLQDSLRTSAARRCGYVSNQAVLLAQVVLGCFWLPVIPFMLAKDAALLLLRWLLLVGGGGAVVGGGQGADDAADDDGMGGGSGDGGGGGSDGMEGGDDGEGGKSEGVWRGRAFEVEGRVRRLVQAGEEAVRADLRSEAGALRRQMAALARRMDAVLSRLPEPQQYQQPSRGVGMKGY